MTEVEARLNAAEQTEWLSVQEAAARINVSPITLRKWINRNIIRAYRVKGTKVWRLKPEDVDNAVEANF